MTVAVAEDKQDVQDNMQHTHIDGEAVGCLNILNIIKLGAGFFFIFSAYISLQNLMPQLLKDLGFERLGFMLVSVIYVAFLFSAVVAPVALQYYSELRSLWLSSLGYAVFCACLILPASCSHCSTILSAGVLIVAALILGVCAAFLWVPQGAIMTYNSPQRLTNMYQMIFQTCFQAASPAGFAMSWVMVGSATTFFVIFTCMSLLGTLLLATIRQPTHHASIPVHEKALVSLRQTIAPMAAFISRDSRARAIGVYGLLIATVFNALPSCVLPMFASGTPEVAKLLLSLGVGTFVSSMVFGHVADRFGRYACLLAGLIVHALSLGLLSLSKCGNDANECMASITLVASVLIGLANGTLFANFFACISGAVHDVAHVAFATQQFSISLGSVITFALLPLLSSTAALITCASVLVISAMYLVSHPQFFRTLQLEDPRAGAEDHGPSPEAEYEFEDEGEPKTNSIAEQKIGELSI